MGSTTLTKRFPGALTVTELRKAFGDLVDSDRAEYGYDGYSGSWATCGHLSVLSEHPRMGLSAAEDRYAETVEKRTSIAVRVIDDELTPEERKTALGKLEERVAEAQRDLAAFGPSFLKRVKEAKSKTRGCAACGSSIAVLHLRCEPWGETTVKCPVCGERDFCVPEGDRERKAKLAARVAEAKAAVAAEEAKVKAKKTEPVWLVVGCASC